MTRRSGMLLAVLVNAIVTLGANGAAAQPAPLASIAFSNEVEASLVRALESLKTEGIKPALRELDATLAKNPNFRLGHLMKGDLLMAKAGTPTAFTGLASQPELVSSLKQEARARLSRYFDGPPSNSLPTALLQLSPDQQHVLLLDSENSRLYVYKNVDGAPEYVADYYVSVGKNGTEKERQGDQRTPLGVYQVTSSVARAKLIDFYGPGAFPINYPNEWDKRNAKTGSGIWIHGTPSNTYSRPPRASDGCVVLTNEDFSHISKYVTPGVTPIIIASHVKWLSHEEWLAAKSTLADSLSGWKRDWESLDMEKYLSHYSHKFDADGKNFSLWAENKRRINAGKKFVNVEISNLSVFEYPLAPNTLPMAMVTFEQTYKSSNNN
ncbi:MAG: L,D-transpeptidase family protein, partial [Betaproteobacteria bacterium]